MRKSFMESQNHFLPQWIFIFFKHFLFYFFLLLEIKLSNILKFQFENDKQ